MARPRKDAIEGLKDKLYSRKMSPDIHLEERTPLSPEHTDLPVAWNDGTSSVLDPVSPDTPLVMQVESYGTMTKKKKMSFSAKFFLLSLIFFIGALGVSGYLVLKGTNTVSPQNIDLQVVAPSLIDGGKQASLQVLISNRNQSILQNADLIIDYPDGARDINDQTKPLTHERISIGDIPPGGQVKRTISGVFYGQEGAEQKVKVSLEYSVPVSNAVFDKVADGGTFTIGSSPVTVTIASPEEAISGQPFGIDVMVQSNATTPIDNVVVEGQYPFGFTFGKSNPNVSSGQMLWRLGTLAPGAKQIIHIDGTLDGQDSDQRVFRFSVGSDPDQTNATLKVAFLSVPQTLTIHKPFIAATITVNGQTGKNISIPVGQPVSGTINWTNNLTDSVANLELVLSLAGPVLDQTSISASSGFFQSSNSTITWSKDQDATFGRVPPGASGVASFTFSTLPPSTGSTLYTNPTVSLNLAVAGTRQDESKVPESVASAASAQILVSTALLFKASAVHFSGTTPNTGPMPPVAEQKTTYGIVWTITNSSNTIANGVVTATLPQYVTYVGSDVGSGISYKASSRTVTWNLGDIKAGAGYSLPARVGTFQVALTPSVSQVGQNPTLTGLAHFTGQDRFAQVGLDASVPGPTTALAPEPGYLDSMGRVSPKQ